MEEVVSVKLDEDFRWGVVVAGEHVHNHDWQTLGNQVAEDGEREEDKIGFTLEDEFAECLHKINFSFLFALKNFWYICILRIYLRLADVSKFTRIYSAHPHGSRWLYDCLGWSKHWRLAYFWLLVLLLPLKRVLLFQFLYLPDSLQLPQLAISQVQNPIALVDEVCLMDRHDDCKTFFLAYFLHVSENYLSNIDVQRTKGIVKKNKSIFGVESPGKCYPCFLAPWYVRGFLLYIGHVTILEGLEILLQTTPLDHLFVVLSIQFFIQNDILLNCPWKYNQLLL